MFKKFIFILLAGVILVALMGTDATAGCKIRNGKLVCSDLTIASEITGVNLKKDTQVCTTFVIRDARAKRVVNPGGQNYQAVSDNFNPQNFASLQDVP